MRRLLPSTTDLPVTDVYAGLVLPAPMPGADRASLALGMVVSLDGAVTREGRSAGLGGPADQIAFRRLRAACDAILVGAGTARTEDYGPPRVPSHRAAARVAAGLAPGPQLLVVTNSGNLRSDARLFTAARDEGVPRPIVVTHDAVPAARLAALRAVADVAVVGQHEVDLAALSVWCLDRGFSRVLCEGGPTLNGGLLAAGLVDEVFLTLAPQLLAGAADRIVVGPSLEPPCDLQLLELHEHDGELLLRYRVIGPGQPTA